jgi:hypothetical protein
MKSELRRYTIIALSTVVSGVILACGGTNNDQGVSVTFLGIYRTIPNSIQETATPTPSNNNNNNNNNNNQTGCATIPTSLSGTGVISVGPDHGVDAIAGIQNNLSGQFFQTNQLTVDFFIAGASIQPPSYTVGLSILAGPAEAASNNSNNNNTTDNNNNNGNTNNGGGSGTDTLGPNLRQPNYTSLPPSFYNICNTQFRRIPLLPNQVGEWLYFNRDLLPQAPYTIDVTARFVGQSSAGDTFETNSIYIPIEVRASSRVSAQDAESGGTQGSESNSEDSSSGDDQTSVVLDGFDTEY